MNDLTTFSNPEFGQVRTVEIDGTPRCSSRPSTSTLRTTRSTPCT